MLYYLLENFEKYYDFPGSGLYKYLSFRAGLALMLSLLISTIYGKRIICLLQRKQIGETVRDLGLRGRYAYDGGDYHYSLYAYPSVAFGKIGQCLYAFASYYNSLDGCDRLFR